MLIQKFSQIPRKFSQNVRATKNSLLGTVDTIYLGTYNLFLNFLIY